MTQEGEQWWRVWAGIFKITLDTEEELLIQLSSIVNPCHPWWHLVYVHRCPVANDNREHHA